MAPLFEILKSFLILNKKLFVVTFLFEVNWLSGLGVKGIFLVFKGGGLPPPLFDSLKMYLDSE